MAETDVIYFNGYLLTALGTVSLSYNVQFYQLVHMVPIYGVSTIVLYIGVNL